MRLSSLEKSKQTNIADLAMPNLKEKPAMPWKTLVSEADQDEIARIANGYLVEERPVAAIDLAECERIFTQATGKPHKIALPSLEDAIDVFERIQNSPSNAGVASVPIFQLGWLADLRQCYGSDVDQTIVARFGHEWVTTRETYCRTAISQGLNPTSFYLEAGDLKVAAEYRVAFPENEIGKTFITDKLLSTISTAIRQLSLEDLIATASYVRVLRPEIKLMDEAQLQQALAYYESYKGAKLWSEVAAIAEQLAILMAKDVQCTSEGVVLIFNEPIEEVEDSAPPPQKQF